eukprot:969879-Lingulodinium_polyedra.AAC.1
MAPTKEQGAQSTARAARAYNASRLFDAPPVDKSMLAGRNATEAPYEFHCAALVASGAGLARHCSTRAANRSMARRQTSSRT